MRTIEIKRLSLENFKGISLMDVDFSHRTAVRGANGTGKTTLFDAFTWCLFGKDSTGKTDFEIKTKVDGNTVQKVPHRVSAVLDVDGCEKVFTRELTEKWTKPRGQSVAVFTGNETHYYVDGCEIKAKDYDTAVSGVIEETLFRMVTNPAYFPSLPWQQRREILLQLAGDLAYEEVAKGHENFERLLAEISGKDLVAYKQELAYRRKRIKEELEQCPVKIEAIRSVTPEPLDFAALEAEKTRKTKELAEVERLMDEVGAAERKRYEAEKAAKDEIYRLMSQQNDLINAETLRRKQACAEKNAGRAEAQERKGKVLQETLQLDGLYKERISRINAEGERAEKRIEELTRQQDAKREEWQRKSAETYPLNTEYLCPITKKPCGDGKAVEIFKGSECAAQEAFNKRQSEELERITQEGKALAGHIETERAAMQANDKLLDEMLEEYEGKKTALNKELAHLEEVLETTPQVEVEEVKGEDIPEWVTLQAKIEDCKGWLVQKPAPASDSENKAKRAALLNEIAEIDKKLSVFDVIRANSDKIEEIAKREKELAQQQAAIEGKEYTLECLNRARMDEVEARVNKMFRHVRFALFERQINGNMVECCNILVDGVKYGYGANHAAEVNAGLDIINTLCQFNGVSAPIFIDNAESVVELITPENSQVVSLVVDKDCPELTIE
ncbi:MAG: hypothetical protein NC324_10870 [Bacteroides sp.]|nr:hypothetical protein [Bacteroides sp.]